MTTTAEAAAGGGTSVGGDTAAAMRAIVGELSSELFERGEVARMLMVAMLAGEHSIVVGPTGTAKSRMARALMSRIEGARLWVRPLNAYTTPTDLFGPIDVAALTTRGVYTQVFEGRAAKAELAFVDEIFKGSPKTLNAMLTLLEERLYYPDGGGEPLVCPLISAMTASNELPGDEETAALYDRLLVRLVVGYLEDLSNFAKLMRSAAVASGSVPSARTTVQLAELADAVASEVPAVQVPEGAIDVVCQLRTVLGRQGIIASDRRWEAGIRVLQAHAWLDGRRAVCEREDVPALSHVLWGSPADRGTVHREILKIVNSQARELLELIDALDELAAELDGMAGKSGDELSKWAAEANGKLRDTEDELSEMRREALAAGRSMELIERAASRHREVYGQVLHRALNVSAHVAYGK